MQIKPLPYLPISQVYQKRFGGKVYKIPVTTVDTCPNREGYKGMETCSFCDVWGSAANADTLTMDFDAQIEKYKKRIGEKFNSKMFLIYFQAYTNSFTKLTQMENLFNQGLQYDFVKGFVVGTRPDCLSPALLRLWQKVHEKSFVSIELGVQSFFDDQLLFLKRGHTAQKSLDAIHRISQETSVDLGIHLIFGNPNETDDHIVKTAEKVNSLPIHNVKLHNLHVLKKTELEKLFFEGKFTPIDKELYAHRVLLFLQHLRKDIAIHRLAGFAPRWEELIAPEWTSDKMGTHQFIVDYIHSHNGHQGKNLSALP